MSLEEVSLPGEVSLRLGNGPLVLEEVSAPLEEDAQRPEGVTMLLEEVPPPQEEEVLLLGGTTLRVEEVSALLEEVLLRESRCCRSRPWRHRRTRTHCRRLQRWRRRRVRCHRRRCRFGCRTSQRRCKMRYCCWRGSRC